MKADEDSCSDGDDDGAGDGDGDSDGGNGDDGSETSNLCLHLVPEHSGQVVSFIVLHA